MRSQTANLPPEQQQRLHADFLANERDYVRLRDTLLARYRGQWVAIHDGEVIASGDDLARVTEAAAASGGHPYIAKVGEEETVVFKVRRTEYPEVNGRRVPAFIQPIAGSQERLIGRDVLN